MSGDSKQDGTRAQQFDQLVFQLHRLVFASSHLINRYSSKLGLHGKDGEALLQIWQAELLGEPLSPSDLASQLHLTRAAVSYLTDRLVDSGYIKRQPYDNDRRRTVLKMSELGGTIGHDFTAPIEARLKGLFVNRSNEDLATFTEMLRQFVESLDTSSDVKN